jgi:apolipoprotein N-acyltransferase
MPGLAAVSILCFWLAWPMMPLTPLLFTVFVPLLVMEEHATAERYKRPRRVLNWYWYVTLLGWNLTTTWWVSNSTLIGGIVANLANAGLMMIPLALYRFTRQRLGTDQKGQLLGYFSLVLYWMSFEYIHLSWDLSWPWLTLGNAFAQYPVWVQWYEWTGVFGGSLWVLLGNLLIYFAFFAGGWRFHIRPLIISGLYILLPIGVGLILYSTYQEKGEAHEIVVLQPNIDPFTEKFVGTENFIPYDQQVARFVDMSKQQLTDNTDYLLWPETAIDGSNEEGYFARNPVLRTIKEFKQGYPELSLLSGLTSYQRYQVKETPTARYREDIGHYDVFNTAWFLGDDGFDTTYHKSKLVPGVEIMPYPQVLGFISETLFDLGGTSGGFGYQAERTVFEDREEAGVAPSICYESIYGDYMAEFVRNGADFIFIITNDAWWGNTAGHKQHFAYARLRAIENRRSIARCANTGISGFINQRGDVLQRTEYWEPAVIRGSIQANTEETFYTRYGDYLARTALWIAGFLLIAAFVRKWVV